MTKLAMPMTCSALGAFHVSVIHNVLHAMPRQRLWNLGRARLTRRPCLCYCALVDGGHERLHYCATLGRPKRRDTDAQRLACAILGRASTVRPPQAPCTHPHSHRLNCTVDTQSNPCQALIKSINDGEWRTRIIRTAAGTTSVSVSWSGSAMVLRSMCERTSMSRTPSRTASTSCFPVDTVLESGKVEMDFPTLQQSSAAHRKTYMRGPGPRLRQICIIGVTFCTARATCYEEA